MQPMTPATRERIRELSEELSFLLIQTGKIKEEFYPHEREAILRFLASRAGWINLQECGLAQLGEGTNNDWVERSRKYTKWTKGVINWLIASLTPGKRKTNASNSRGSKD